MLLPPALDAQLQRDADLSVFDFGVLAMLSEAPGRTLRMGQLAALNDSSLSRLSHVVKRLEERGAIVRSQSATDRRANNATLTDEGFALVERAAPAHVERVRQLVFDELTKRQIGQLAEIGEAISKNLDPEHRLPPS
ncbi:MAG: MarR family transcriptional regulator [Actinobacteria bacterium]|nr:MarR family transcriptional regulator [Actinomycetota bacterium]